MIRKLYNILHYFRKFYWRTFKIKTYGVRILAVKDGEVLLVYHRYGNLWVFPGGGVKKNENVRDAARREMKEETGIIINDFERNLGVYKNTTEGKNDTVTVCVVKNWETGPTKIFNIEISDMRFFKFDKLPETVSPATKRRISEYLLKENREFSGNW